MTKIISIYKKLKPYIYGLLRGVLVFGVLYTGLAFFMYKTNAESKALYYLLFAFIILGGFVCGIYVYKKVRGRGFLTGIISSISYSLVVFFIICVLNGFKISDEIFVVFLLSLSGGFLGGVTAANTKI